MRERNNEKSGVRSDQYSHHGKREFVSDGVGMLLIKIGFILMLVALIILGISLKNIVSILKKQPKNNQEYEQLQKELKQTQAEVVKKNRRIQELEHTVEEKITAFLKNDLQELEALNSRATSTIELFSKFMDIGDQRLRMSKKCHSTFQTLIDAEKTLVSRIKFPNGLIELPTTGHDILGISKEEMGNPIVVQAAKRAILKIIHPDKFAVLQLVWIDDLFNELAKVINRF